MSDIGAGMWTAFAAMAAIRHRNEQGEGQYIDISMLDAQVAWMTYQAAYFFANDEPPKRLGAAHPNLVPYQAFMCQDNKYINVAVGSERIWERFCQGMKREELSGNPEYATNGDRVRNRSQLVPFLQEIFLTRPANDWVEDLHQYSVPCGAINDLADVFADPQIKAREMYFGDASPHTGKHQTDRPAHQVLPHARRSRPSAAPSGGAQPRNTGRPGFRRRRDRRNEGQGRDLALPSQTMCESRHCFNEVLRVRFACQ